MVDTTTFSEGQYITPELVKSSLTKTLVVMDEAKPTKTDYGESLQCQVQIDGKNKIWRLNRDSVKNLHQVSTDSSRWIGKKIQLLVITVKGKDTVLGVPIMEHLNN